MIKNCSAEAAKKKRNEKPLSLYEDTDGNEKGIRMKFCSYLKLCYSRGLSLSSFNLLDFRLGGIKICGFLL